MNAHLIKSTGVTSDFLCPHCASKLFFIPTDGMDIGDIEDAYRMNCPDCLKIIFFNVRITMDFTVSS